MAMKSNSRIVLTITLMLLLTSCSKDCTNCQATSTDGTIVPTTEVIPDPITAETPQRVADLTKIVMALEKYKQENQRYPISSDAGRKWDGIYSKYGESKNDWIEGLAPTYINELPRDPRMHTSDTEQYMYRSDGANYKLIAHQANDCKTIKKLTPQIVDPKRDCGAYGFWTAKARMW